MALSLNKRKTLESAQKFVLKGAYDKALKEYQKLVKADPRDTNTRLKIGDLYLKKGDAAQAIQTYAQVAEGFSKSGFDAKAVAIQKQILRIDPSCLPARVNLGELFQRLGLASDALREFQAAIGICEERELKREAFDLLKKVATLDPDNIPNRLRLADLLVRQKLEDEGKEQYTALVNENKDRNTPDVLARICGQMIESFPEDRLAITQLGLARLAMGEAQAAVDGLAQALVSFPEDVPLREALIEAHEANGDEGSKQLLYREIAEIYKKRGDDDRAREILQRFVPVEPFSGDPDSSPSIILSDALGDEVHDLDAGPEIELGPDDEAGAEGEKKAELPPEELLAEARVSLEFGDKVNAEERLDLLLQTHPDFAPAQALLEEIRSGSTRSAAIDTDDDTDTSPSTGTPLPAPAFELTDETDTVPDIELSLEDDDDVDDRFASVDPPAELRAQAEAVEEEELEFSREIEVDGEEEETKKKPPDASAEPTMDVDVESARIIESLEEADFFFEQEMLDEAERAYSEILERAPQHPKAMLRLGEIAEAREAGGADQESQVSPGVPVDDDDDELVTAVTLDSVEVPAAEELEMDVETAEARESGFDLAAELEDSVMSGEVMKGDGLQEVFDAFKRQIQAQIGAEETGVHYDLAIAYREMGLYDDAVSQLEIVRSTGGMQIEMLSLLATCKIEMGQPLEATQVLEEAMDQTSDPESEISLRYDLGEAWLAAGERGKALEAFEKVASADSDHRAVEARIAELS